MITKPIIPIWLMSIVCISIIVLIIINTKLFKKIKGENKTDRQKKLRKEYVIDVIIKIFIVVIIFIMNLRIMIPNGESNVISSDLNILFVIDTSISMKALDYNGNKERMEGVKEVCKYIIDELNGAKYSVISFNDKAEKLLPFTTDSNMIQSTIEILKTVPSLYAKGSSLNTVKDVLSKTISDEEKRKGKGSEFVVFFISDGEITKEDEKLESFSGMSKNIINGAVLGFGTTEGGKMRYEAMSFEDESKTQYMEYYDEKTHDYSTAVSVLDENNLKKISSDLGIDYIKVDKKTDVSTKLRSVKEDLLKSSKNEKKETSYKDTYYYLAIPLTLLLLAQLVVLKRKYM